MKQMIKNILKFIREKKKDEMATDQAARFKRRPDTPLLKGRCKPLLRTMKQDTYKEKNKKCHKKLKSAPSTPPSPP